MKTLFAFDEGLLPSSTAGSQLLEPINWSYTAKKISATEAIIFIKATMAKGWRIYSQLSDGVPIKTAFDFLPTESFQLIGKTVEPEPITKYEKTYNMNVSYFEKTVVFQQKLKLNGGQTIVKGNINFMLCSDNQCMAPETTEFSIPIN